MFPEPPSHLGLVVADLEGAMRSLAFLGRFAVTEPRPFSARASGPDGETAVIGLRAAWAAWSGIRIELLEGIERTVWEPRPQPYLHHLGFWVDEVPERSERLAAAGLPLEIGGGNVPGAPIRFAYHALGGFRLEVSGSDRGREVDASMAAAGAGPAPLDLGRPSHIAAVVPDLDKACRALDGLAGLPWLRMGPVSDVGAVRLGGDDRPHPAPQGWKAWSTLGSLDLELLEPAGPVLAASPQPYLHHLGYAAADLAGASAALARLGIPRELTLWTDSGASRRVAYHELNGLRVEAVDAVRAGEIAAQLRGPAPRSEPGAS